MQLSKKDKGYVQRSLNSWHLVSYLGTHAGGMLLSQVTTDASLKGLGSDLSPSPVGILLAHELPRDEGCIDITLRSFLPDLRGYHVLLRIDNTSVVSYINHQGELRSCPLFRLADPALGSKQTALIGGQSI